MSYRSSSPTTKSIVPIHITNSANNTPKIFDIHVTLKILHEPINILNIELEILILYVAIIPFGEWIIIIFVILKTFHIIENKNIRIQLLKLIK